MRRQNGNRAIEAVAGGLVLILLAACGTTQEHRIRQQARQFAAFPAEIQAAIRAGHVETGFTGEMTYLALGFPVEKMNARGPLGTADYWLYPGVPDPDRKPSDPPSFGFRGRNDLIFRRAGEFQILVIGFRQGRVVGQRMLPWDTYQEAFEPLPTDP